MLVDSSQDFLLLVSGARICESWGGEKTSGGFEIALLDLLINLDLYPPSFFNTVFLLLRILPTCRRCQPPTMASISAGEPLLSTVSPSILREDVAEDEEEDGDRLSSSSSSSFASVSSPPPVNQVGAAIVLEGKTFRRLYRAFFWLTIGLFVSTFLTLLGALTFSSKMGEIRTRHYVFLVSFGACLCTFSLLSVEIIRKMSTLKLFYRGDITPPEDRPYWLLWGGIISATLFSSLFLVTIYFSISYSLEYLGWIYGLIPVYIEVLLLVLSPLFRHPRFISFVARWKIVFGILLFPVSFASFIFFQGVHFLCSLAILIFISVAKMFGFISDPHLFASFRGAAALSLCYIHLLSFPFFKIPTDLLSLRYQQPPSVITTYLKTGIFVIFCLIMPAVDVITDVVYLASFLPVGFGCYQAIDPTFYEQQATELYIWKVLMIVSCAIGCVVTVVHYVGYFFRFRGKDGWLPLRATIIKVSNEVSGDTFDLQKSVIVSTSAKFVGSVGEDLFALLVACGTLGFLGSYSLSWIFNVASSALSIAFSWSVLVSKFVYGKSFSGKAGIWIQANLVLFLAGSLVTIPSVTQTSQHFNYQYRPHELYSDRTEAEFLNCGTLYYCCFAQPFDLNDIQWVTANCNFTIQHEAIENLVFRDLEQIRSNLIIGDNPMLQEVSFQVLQESSYVLEITNNPVLTFLGLSMLKSANFLGVVDNPMLKEAMFSNLQFSSELQINNSLLSSLGFPMLDSAFFVSVVENPMLTEVNFPMLETCDDESPFSRNYLIVSGNPMLQEVNFPRLQNLVFSSCRLEITNNFVLTSLGLPMLEGVDELVVINNTALTSLVCDKLRLVQNAATISDNPMLQVVNFPVLQRLSAPYYPLEITNNSVLTSLGFPQLEMAGLVIVANNTALTSLVCDKLYSMTSATISNNPALQVVHFPSLPSSNACSIVGFEGTVVFYEREVTYPVDDCP